MPASHVDTRTRTLEGPRRRAAWSGCLERPRAREPESGKRARPRRQRAPPRDAKTAKRGRDARGWAARAEEDRPRRCEEGRPRENMVGVNMVLA